MTTFFEWITTDQLIGLVLMVSERASQWERVIKSLEDKGATQEAINKAVGHRDGILVAELMLLQELERRLDAI